MMRNVRTFLVEKTFFLSLDERKSSKEKLDKKGVNYVITLSRQHGCYGAETAIELQKLLDHGWVVFHREILEEISKDIGVEKQFLNQFDEKNLGWVEQVAEGFNHPYINSETYLRALRKFLSSIAQRGKVIVVGRGANLILKQGFHVRLVAPVETRVKNLMVINKYSRSEAVKEIEEGDKERKEFVRRVFNEDIDNPLNYDLIINIVDLNFKEVAQIIFSASKFTNIFR